MVRVISKDFVELCLIHTHLLSQFEGNANYRYSSVRIFRKDNFLILEFSVVPLKKIENITTYDSTTVDSIFTRKPQILKME